MPTQCAVVSSRRRRIAINLQPGPRHTATGRLERRTLLIKRYMIQRTIGHGGMGAVYLASDLKRQTNCAIKEMSLSMVPVEERAQAVQNFKTEAKLLAGLNHPNLPTFSGFFTEGQRHFLVMEYVEGMTLDAFLENNHGPFPERRVLAWAKQLCDVLEYLHSQQPPIIFRDMKPGNIMVMRNGRIKLIDFGIARFFRYSSSQDTQQLGTPGFAPPEQYGKAQTDERSDIYSLAMTLFQLLTNTLSEKGFGLQDVRSINPDISLRVARTLEKATSLKPEDRFQTAGAFRRALLGEGTFIFESGDQASIPEELAELCERFPEEAADYLFAGEIETWLEVAGETDLARTTKDICTQTNDPLDAVEQFVQAVLGTQAHLHTSTGKHKARSRNSQTGQPAIIPPLATTNAAAWTNNRSRVSQTPDTDIEVLPRILDFGEIHPELSEPLMLSIIGNRGNYVHGTLTCSAPWILLDADVFDGSNTAIAVQIDATHLRGHYTGTIFVIPNEEDEEQDITVRVEVDVLGNLPTSLNGQYNRGQSRGSFLEEDEEEEEDDVTQSWPNAGSSTRMAPLDNPRPPAPANPPVNTRYSNEKYDEYLKKYGLYSANNNSASGWEPLQASPRQQLWLKRGLTVFASFMLASLFYTVLSELPFLAHHSILAPNPWFIVALLGMIPSATLGALAINWGLQKNRFALLNRLCTGLGTTLLALGIIEPLWALFLHQLAPPFHLFLMLLLAALAATTGTNALISEKITERFLLTMAYMHRLVIIATVVIGGILGFTLTLGFPFSGFTLLSVAVGIAIAMALILPFDHMLKQQPLEEE